MRRSLGIDRAEAWQRLSEPVWDEWVFLTWKVTWNSGPPGLGMQYRETGPFGRTHWQITTWQPPEVQVHEGRVLGMRHRLTFRFGDGTFSMAVEGRGLLGYLSWPLLWLFARRISAAFLRFIAPP